MHTHSGLQPKTRFWNLFHFQSPFRAWVVKSFQFTHQFSSVHSVAQSCPTLCAPWTAACQASLSITNTQSLPKLMSIVLPMPSNHLILCRPLLLQNSNFQHQQLFKWVSSLNQVPTVLDFQLHHHSFQWIFRTDFVRMDSLDLLEVQRTLKSLL